MKFLFCNKFFWLKGGAEVSFFETAKLLESKGHKVVFFSMKHSGNFPSPYEKYFVSKVDYEGGGSICSKIKAAGRLLYSFEAKAKIEKLIKEERPDIVHLNNIHHQISPSILHTFKKWNLPVVMTLRDYKIVCPTYSMLANGKPCEKCKGGKYYWCLINKCTKNSYAKSLVNVVEMYLHHKILHIYDLIDVFISPSKFLKEKLEEMGFKKKVAYLPNFIDAEDYELEYKYTQKTICYFGRLSKEKGLFTLLDAMKGIDVKLKIIGDGSLKECLRLKVKSENSDNVYFLGYKVREELKNEIKNSMVVVFPSECYENNPRTVLESFALGKPVVGARIGGIPELVKDNETGLTFEPGNTKDLRDKIEILLAKPDKIVEMGKNARKFVEENFKPEKHYEQLMEIYKMAMAGHK